MTFLLLIKPFLSLPYLRPPEFVNIVNNVPDVVLTVTLKNLDTGGEVERTLVPSEEADAERGRISVESPIAKGLLGHSEGDEVEIKVPAGVVRYKIMKISR